MPFIINIIFCVAKHTACTIWKAYRPVVGGTMCHHIQYLNNILSLESDVEETVDQPFVYLKQVYLI